MQEKEMSFNNILGFNAASLGNFPQFIQSLFPFTTQNGTYFSPNSLAPCSLWLDAADLNTLTLSGTNITAWRDKSGTGNNAVNPNPGTTNLPTLTSWSNNLAAARFSIANQNAIRTTNNIPAVNVTYFIILRIRAVSGYSIFLLNNVDGQRQMNVNTSAFPANINVSFNSSLGSVVPITVSQNQEFLLCASTDSSTLSLFANGALTANNTQTVNASSDSQNFFGAGNGPGPYTDCDFGEIIIYNTALSTAARQRTEGYLAWKWGLVSSLPNGHPFKATPYLPFSYAIPRLLGISRWSPLRPGNCSLWLDALDPLNNGSIPTIGSTPATWVDKSGTANNATTAFPGTTNMPSITTWTPGGPPALRFLSADSNAIKTANTINAYTVTYFMVFRVSSVNGYGVILLNNTDGQRQWNVNTSAFPANINANPGGVVVTAVNQNQNIILCQTISNNTTLQTFYYLNGSIAATQSASGFGSTTANTIHFFGGGNGPGPYANCDIAEILIYNAEFTLSQRQQVEGYLAWKWGLQGSLPGAHPFKLFPPIP